MPINEIILNTFALQNIKPKLYGTGNDLEVNGSSFTIQSNGKKPSPLSIKKNQSSLLGTSVFSDMLLDNGIDQLYIDAALFEVSRQKNIVLTQVTGRDTSVKEYINSNDYIVNVKGVLHTFKSNNYPIGDVNALISIFDTNTAIKVICPFLRLFGIFNIVIQDHSIPQKEGTENLQPFQFTAISDEPIELIEDV